jgi:copper chaperone CopZ
MNKKLFTVSGMTCHACQRIVEMTASDFPQIKACEVDFKTGRGFVEYESGFDPDRFKNEINRIGQYTLEFNA